jgi:adenylate kinase family enzyme
MKKKTVIVAAFPCCGKSTVAETLKDFYSIVDLDSSDYRWADRDKSVPHSNFPNNYIESIVSLIGKKDVVFISTHKEVLDALQNKKINFVLVYPQNTPVNKSIWRERLVTRGSSQDLIDKIMYNWDDMLDDLTEVDAMHYILGEEADGEKNRIVLDAISLEHILEANKRN